MDAINEVELQRYIRALKRKGCEVLRDENGQFIVKLLPNHEYQLGQAVLQRNEVYEWQTVMEAVERLGLTADDLGK